MDTKVLAELAPTGVLRVGVNLANFLLVTGRSPSGDPEGVSPDLSRAVAEKLGVPVRYVTFERPDILADAVGTGAWDIALIGAEPARAEKIAFTAAYSEIEASYLVPAGSKLQSFGDVDQPGVRIAAAAGSAYDLWLRRNIRHAELVHVPTIEESFHLFKDNGLDALAGLRPRLIADEGKLPGSRILPGRLMAVQQAVGTARENSAGAAFLRDFVEEAKRSGMIGRLIAKHDVKGLTVAAAADAPA